MILLGLYGDSRCGKDTIAEILKEYGFEQRVMADPIREMLFRINPLLGYDHHGPIHLDFALKGFKGDWNFVKGAFPEVVDYMINLGQAARDIIAPDVWLAPVMRDLGERTVISDIRQPNEYDAVKYFGGEVWHITRPGTVPRGMDRLLNGYKFDAIIENNNTIYDLRMNVSDELRRLNVTRAHPKEDNLNQD